ncbi:alpha/beta hydrolase [Patescibacteria group bacterium]
MLEIVKEILLILVLVYVGFGVVLFFSQKSIIYYPDSQDFESCPGFEDSEKLNLNGTRAYFKKSSDRLVVFYHGNAGSACDRAFLKDRFEKDGLSYLFVEYAGYSGDSKKPSSDLLIQDVENIVEFIGGQDFKEVFVGGGSIGSSLAIYHSKLARVDKMLLVTPFYSVKDMAKKLYGVYPISLMLTDNYDSNEWIKETKAGKIKIIHGEEDEIIPISQSRKLYEEILVENKEYVSIKDAHHNDIYDFKETWTAISNFLAKSND